MSHARDGRPPILFHSPDTPSPVAMRLARPRYQRATDEPLVFRLGSIAVWYDGQTLRLARLDTRGF